MGEEKVVLPVAAEDVYSFYCGPIDERSTANIINNISTAINRRVRRFHVMLQSPGGNIGDGICLHNFLRNAPIETVFYNSGNISSSAFVVYLGAKKRIVSANAAFMMHLPVTSFQFAKSSQLKSLTDSISIDDARVESILREFIKDPDDALRELATRDLWFSATDAVRIGVAHAIGEFIPPPGASLYNLAPQPDAKRT